MRRPGRQARLGAAGRHPVRVPAAEQDGPRGAPDRPAPQMQVNFDVRQRLHVCREAEANAEEVRRPATARA
jgi:hypothetical protein